MNNRELVDRRHNIIQNAIKLRVVSKKDGRINSQRHCCLCGRSLTNYDSITNRYYVAVKHYKFSFFTVFEGYLCYDIRSCKSTLKKEGKQDDKTS